MTITAFKEILQHYAHVGALSLRTPTERNSPQLVVEPKSQMLNFHDIAEHAMTCLPEHLRWEGDQQFLQWMRNVHDPMAQVKWVSWIELLLHFQMRTGRLGMICRGRGHRRQWIAADPRQEVGFRKLAVRPKHHSAEP